MKKGEIDEEYSNVNNWNCTNIWWCSLHNDKEYPFCQYWIDFNWFIDGDILFMAKQIISKLIKT